MKKQYEEVVKKTNQLIDLKKIESFVTNAAEVVEDSAGVSPLKIPGTGDFDNFLSKMAEKDSLKKLKREMEGWREIILQVHSVLLWEKSWYPGMIAGISTLVFTLLWIIDPSLLSAFSSAALLVTLVDYLVPMVTASLYSPAHWTGAMEKQYEDICKTLVRNYNIGARQFTAFLDLKVSSPKLYYTVTITSLILLAYIGNKVNNLVLTYILVTSLLMMPGLAHHGILHKYYQLLLHSVTNVLKSLQGGGSGDKLKVN